MKLLSFVVLLTVAVAYISAHDQEDQIFGDASGSPVAIRNLAANPIGHQTTYRSWVYSGVIWNNGEFALANR